MNRTIRRFLCLLATFAMTTAAAYAADTKVQATNGDSAQQFDVIDTNKDGALTLPEIEVYGGKALAKRLHACDTNKDARISHDEYIACKISAHAEVGIEP